jgi:hypothetical protein
MTKVSKEFSSEELMCVVYGDQPGWSELRGERKILDQGRWVTLWCSIFKHEASGRHYEIGWERASTEQQEGSESNDPTCIEVELKEVLVKQWVPVSEA